MTRRPAALTITGEQVEALRAHLFPGDAKEAAAIALCGRAASPGRLRLLVRELHPVPYEVCRVRSSVQIVWPVEWLDKLLERADRETLSIVKFHSHPTGFDDFSTADDISDRHLFTGIHAWLDNDIPHASVVVLPDGGMFGRLVSDQGRFSALSMISSVGDELRFHCPTSNSDEDSAKPIGRATKAFGRSMMTDLRELRIAIVGCSGTGSVVVEQLARLGVGHLLLVDPDVIHRKNLNRILNATEDDASHKRHKVEVLARAIEGMGLKTKVDQYPLSILEREAIGAVASCDVVFGCVDSVEARHIINCIATHYLLPYLDIGVGLVALEDGSIDQINGVIHYVQPGRSSLLSRRAYRPEQLAAEALARSNPDEYASREKEGYIEGVIEEQPAVISVNMTIASFAVNEFLARLYGFRNSSNARYAEVRINLTEMEIVNDAEPSRPCRTLRPYVGIGDGEPPLGLIELSSSTL
jgi:molybdopterin/thiamine biosynthesis adenylyltransferase